MLIVELSTFHPNIELVSKPSLDAIMHTSVLTNVKICFALDAICGKTSAFCRP